MEYVRESWNLLRTPQNLIESLEDKNDIDFIKDVVVALLNLNSNPNISTTLLQDYLAILFLHYPNIFIEILSSPSCKEYGLGFIQLINQVGLKFINFLNVDDHVSAQCIINILNFSILLEPEDICMNSLKILSNGLKFSTLIASSRVYFEQEIHDIRKMIDDKFFHDSFVPPTLMMNQFRKSIFSDCIANDSTYQKHNLVSLIIWNIIATHQDVFLSKFLTKRSLVLLFLHIVTMYAKTPSLSLAYLMFYTFPKILNENMNQIIIDIKEFENEAEETDESHYFLKSIVVEKILTTEQFTEPPPSELIKSIYSCPKSIITFSDKLFQITAFEKVKLLYEMAPSLIESSTDVIMYLSLQNQLSNFLLRLAQVCENPLIDKEFCQIWLLFLHYIHSSWSQGSKTLREMVNSILGKVQNGTRFFLTALLTYKKPDFDLTLENRSSHFEKSIILLDKLLKNPDFDKFILKIVEKSNQVPHFLPSVLLCCICNPIIDYLRLPSVAKFPNNPIINTLFNHFMFIVSTVNDQQATEKISKPAYYNIYHYPNYEIMVRFPGIDECELKMILKDHVMNLITTDLFSFKDFNRIACIWRSWLTTFGIKKFTCEVFDALNVLLFSINVLYDSSIILEKLALMFGCICEDDKEKEVTRTSLFFEILDTIFENFREERFQNKELASGISSFCITLISLIDRKEEFDLLLDKTFDFAKSCLIHNPMAGETKSPENKQFKVTSTFALSFIKKALFTPIFQNKIISSPCDYLVNINDWKTLTDFFIVKAKINAQD